ncbi:MAG: TrkA C-terminal domain-containing protein [Oscillospiraceae bacterium]|nr:TrkA C-terminal domain-containing protein [Oscillospiraceae bacterium]
MNIYAAASLFAVLILLYWVISEVFTVLFRLIGLPEEKARFQVVSLLTGTGFTTRESEMILSTRSRRRLARITVLFGYVFNITFVSAVVNVFLSTGTGGFFSSVLSMLIPLAALTAVLILTRIREVRIWLDRKIERVADNMGSNRNYNGVTRIDELGSQIIARVSLRTVPEELEGKTLSELGLKPKKKILVLMLEHADRTGEDPTAKTVFRPGDRVTVCGDYRQICKVFQARERFSDD